MPHIHHWQDPLLAHQVKKSLVLFVTRGLISGSRFEGRKVKKIQNVSVYPPTPKFGPIIRNVYPTRRYHALSEEVQVGETRRDECQTNADCGAVFVLGELVAKTSRRSCAVFHRKKRENEVGCASLNFTFSYSSDSARLLLHSGYIEFAVV